MQKYHYPESMKTIFSQDFENATEVSKAGGVLTGSPVVKKLVDGGGADATVATAHYVRTAQGGE